MNRKQLQKLGVPPDCTKAAIQALSRAAGQGSGIGLKGKRARQLVAAVLDNPRAHERDPIWGEFARELLAEAAPVARQPISYQTWGSDIDTAAHEQMRGACQVPSAVAAALMPDAHVGYGLPIGGVLACENAVIPYAVGVDIACRMKLSILDQPVESLASEFNRYKEALLGGTDQFPNEDWVISSVADSYGAYLAPSPTGFPPNFPLPTGGFNQADYIDLANPGRYAQVPEPSALTLALLTFAGWFVRRSR